MFKFKTVRTLTWIGLILALTACSKGGKLSLEPGAIRDFITKGSPMATVNQGGAMVVQQGQTAKTGIHGYVTVQDVKAVTVKNTGSGHYMILNTPQAHQNIMQK
jgi:hypothetical protein